MRKAGWGILHLLLADPWRVETVIVEGRAGVAVALGRPGPLVGVAVIERGMEGDVDAARQGGRQHPPAPEQLAQLLLHRHVVGKEAAAHAAQQLEHGEGVAALRQLAARDQEDAGWDAGAAGGHHQALVAEACQHGGADPERRRRAEPHGDGLRARGVGGGGIDQHGHGPSTHVAEVLGEGARGGELWAGPRRDLAFGGDERPGVGGVALVDLRALGRVAVHVDRGEAAQAPADVPHPSPPTSRVTAATPLPNPHFPHSTHVRDTAATTTFAAAAAAAAAAACVL